MGEVRNDPFSFLEDISERTGCDERVIMSWMAEFADPNESQCKVLWRWVQEMATHLVEHLKVNRPEAYRQLMKDIGRDA